MFTCLFFTQDNLENLSQDQVIRTEARQDFEPKIDPNEVPFYKVLLLLLFAFFLFCFVLLWFGGVSLCACGLFFNARSISLSNGQVEGKSILLSSVRWLNHLVSNKREWNNCFIKNARKISRILPDFICKNNRFSACF